MDGEAWLAERLAQAPASLRARIDAALSAHGSRPTGAGGTAGTGDLAGRLQSVAEELLEQARSGPPTRETALTLLAADALVTLACEWVAASEPERLGEMR